MKSQRVMEQVPLERRNQTMLSRPKASSRARPSYSHTLGPQPYTALVTSIPKYLQSLNAWHHAASPGEPCLTPAGPVLPFLSPESFTQPCLRLQGLQLHSLPGGSTD